MSIPVVCNAYFEELINLSITEREEICSCGLKVGVHKRRPLVISEKSDESNSYQKHSLLNDNRCHSSSSIIEQPLNNSFYISESSHSFLRNDNTNNKRSFTDMSPVSIDNELKGRFQQNNVKLNKSLEIFTVKQIMVLEFSRNGSIYNRQKREDSYRNKRGSTSNNKKC
jgi:hypothetical protein